MSAFNETLFIDREMKVRGFQKLLRPETPQAIMLIRDRPLWGVLVQAIRTNSHCIC